MVNHGVPSLITQLQVKHGPSELFSRFFIKAIQAVNDRGISLRVGNFTELEEINQRNSDSWRPLFPSLSPSVGGAENSSGYAIIGVDHIGDPVATLGSRIFEWKNTNLKKQAQELTFFYNDLEKAREGETCEVTSKIAKTITGRVSLGGGIWNHPDYRGHQIIELMTRINRAYAYVTYNVDQHFGLLAPAAVKNRIHTKSGFREVDEALIMKNSTSYPGKDVSMMVIRAYPHDIIDDAYLFLSHWRSKTD